MRVRVATPCRTYESFEVVGLIFHHPELVGACSEQALIQALKALLHVLSTTKDKVHPCLPCCSSGFLRLDQSGELLTSFEATCSGYHHTSGLVMTILVVFVQHAAKHALWALSQQTLPAAVLQPEITSCCALLLPHMQLPVTSRSSAAATR